MEGMNFAGFVEQYVAIQVEAATAPLIKENEELKQSVARLSIVGAPSRTLTFPEGVTEVSLTELLNVNNIVIDWDNNSVTIRPAGETSVKIADQRTIVSDGATISYGRTDPNGHS
jgi:hypothetical protein